MRGVLVVLLMAAPVWADPVPHREGSYGGVTPGEVQPRDPAGKPAKAKRPPPRGTLTWVGYAARNGGAEVFFQSPAPFELEQRVESGAVVVHLGLTRLGHNTWRQVDTRFFEGPVAGIVARAVGAARATKAKDRPARSAGLEARITFKNPQDAREATLRTATEADGMYYAYLVFPAGSAPGPEAPSASSSGAPPAQEPPATPPSTDH